MTYQIPSAFRTVSHLPTVFVNPQPNDIVRAFGRVTGIITQNFATEDNINAPMLVVDLETGSEMMVKKSEMVVVARESLQVLAIEANVNNTKERATQIAIEFDKAMNE